MKFTLCNHEVRIDREDFETFLSHVWQIHKTKNNIYLRTTINGHYVKLHRLLTGVTDKSVLVDHRDRNGLNNCRHNLRVATPLQNSHNRRRSSRGSSQFKGVFWDNQTQSWRAECSFNLEKRNLGRFKDEVAAALAYDLAALCLHKDFASPNFTINEAILVHRENLEIAIEACRKRGLIPELFELRKAA